MIAVIDLYLFLLFLTGIFSFILAYYAWQKFVIQQKMTPAKYFTIVLSCVGIWSFGSGLALWYTSEVLTYFCEQWKYIGIVFIPPTWLLLASSWTGRDEWINKKTVTFLYSISILSLVIIFTDQIHHLFWQEIQYVSIGSFLDTAVVHGPAWWLFWSYAYIMLIIATTYLVKSAITLHGFYKKQAFLLLLGALIPWIANATYSLGVSSFVSGSFDFTPISFVFTGLILTYGFTHFKLINLFPVSRELVFNNLQDPVIVFDTNKRLIELNKSAEKCFQLNSDKVIGRCASDVFSSYPMILDSFQQVEIQHSFEMKINDASIHYFDVTISKTKGRNQPPGYVLSFRDITKRKKVTNALKESEKQFHAIFEGVNDAVFLHEISTGRIVNANKKAVEMYGYTKNEFKKLSVSDLTAGNQAIGFDVLNREVENVKKGLLKNVEWHAKDKNGNQFWVEVNPTIISIENEEFILVSVRDIDDKKKAQIQLKESEEKFRTFTESASIAIMIYQDDKWIYANPYAEKISGYSKDELVNMNFWDFIHPEYKDLVIQRGKARQHGQHPPSRYEFKIISKQGVEKWVDFRAETIMITGKLAVLITASDITKQKRSAETINKQLTAIKSSMDGVGILNEQGEYVYLNDAHASIYGYDSPKSLLGESWRMLYAEKELRRFDEEIMPFFEKNGRWRGEAVGKKKDGTLFNQEITLTALDDGGLICVVRDITRQKMVVKELQDAHDILFTVNKDLERKVKKRTEQIEKLVKQKDNFINQLGHDLKTPLTPMMVLLPMLKKKTDDEKEMELFDVVIRNVYFMKDLVNKTIDLAKLNSDKIDLSFEETDLSEQAKNVISNNQVLFDRNNIMVVNNLQRPIMVEADVLRLNEVFNNLITNAVKYSKKNGGKITIDADEGKENVTVSIQDAGIGMTKQQISHIFDEFYKADESRHELDSSGLGLSIAKKIINKHGGRIWAESPGPGKGTTFFFTLKKHPEESIDAKSEEIIQNA